MSGVLKRKYEEVEEDPCYSSSSPSSLSSSAYSEWDSDGESCYSDTLDSTPSNPSSPATSLNTTSILKKAKRTRRGNVQFDQVTVFFFPRCQGFTSVPSRGGCTLGMVQRHSAQRRYTLAEFAVAQRHLRREKLKNRMKEEKLEALKLKLTKNGTQESEEAERLTVDDIPEDEIDLSGVNLDDGSFLHPYPSKRRLAILKAAGVKKIDKEEKRQLHELRTSREDCGCDCQGFCQRVDFQHPQNIVQNQWRIKMSHWAIFELLLLHRPGNPDGCEPLHVCCVLLEPRFSVKLDLQVYTEKTMERDYDRFMSQSGYDESKCL